MLCVVSALPAMPYSRDVPNGLAVARGWRTLHLVVDQWRAKIPVSLGSVFQAGRTRYNIRIGLL